MIKRFFSFNVCFALALSLLLVIVTALAGAVWLSDQPWYIIAILCGFVGAASDFLIYATLEIRRIARDINSPRHES